jgi:outer membrane protein
MLATSMNSLRAISLTLLASVVTAAAAPRFAMVRIKDIYAGLPTTVAMQQELKKERDDIVKDPRAEQLRKIIGELQSIQAQLADKANPLDEAANRNLARTYDLKRQEAQTLQQEFESYKTEQEKTINRKMVTRMRDSLNRIVTVSQQVAKECGYDSVFDSSGDTNTGVPFVLFSKDTPDLTADIQTALNRAPANSP